MKFIFRPGRHFVLARHVIKKFGTAMSLFCYLAYVSRITHRRVMSNVDQPSDGSPAQMALQLRWLSSSAGAKLTASTLGSGSGSYRVRTSLAARRSAIPDSNRAFRTANFSPQYNTADTCEFY